MATSRSSVLDPLELGDVGVDDDREAQLVQVDLLAQDQVQEEVEGALEDRGLDLVRHPAIVSGRLGRSAAMPGPRRRPESARRARKLGHLRPGSPGCSG